MVTTEREDKTVYVPESGRKSTPVAITAPFPGAKRPFEEGANLGMWHLVTIDSNKIEIPESDVYILAAWHPIYRTLLNLSRNAKLGVMWTSSAGEMDMTPVEIGFLNAIVEDPRISFIWFGDESLHHVYPEKSFYASYPFDVDHFQEVKVDKQDIAVLFCPSGYKKNILNMLMAMKLVQKDRKLVLHTNIAGYDDILKSIEHVSHSWLPHDEYYELLASARVNLAVSWAETYDYNVAEASLLGTPSVISSTVPVPGLVVNEPNNPRSIAHSIFTSLSLDKDDISINTEYFKSWSRENNKALRDKFKSVLSIDLPDVV